MSRPGLDKNTIRQMQLSKALIVDADPSVRRFELTPMGPRRPKSAGRKCGDASKVRALLKRLDQQKGLS